MPPRSHTDRVLAAVTRGGIEVKVEDKAETPAETDPHAEESRRLLIAVRGIDRRGSGAAVLMDADPAIVRAGRTCGPAPVESSRRLLAHIRTVASSPGSPVVATADPAVVRVRPVRGTNGPRGQTGNGTDLMSVDPSIVHVGPAEDATTAGEPTGTCSSCNSCRRPGRDAGCGV